jgi:hypothetical protein
MSNILRAILVSGTLSAILDGLCVTALYYSQSVPPIRLWQNVASSVLGKSSFEHGWYSGALGLLLHCAVAFTASSVFVLLAQKVTSLLTHPFASGAIFGLIVFAVMNLVIIPLSRMPKRSIALSGILIQVVMHIVLVGIPIALATRFYLRLSSH